MKGIIFTLAFVNLLVLFLQRAINLQIIVFGISIFLLSVGVLDLFDRNEKLQKELKKSKE